MNSSEPPTRRGGLVTGANRGIGFEVARQLATRGILIVLSARDPQSNEERALKAGAAAFFQKPADNDELMNVIRVSLAPGKAQAAPWPS